MNGQKLNVNAFEFKPRFSVPATAPPPERPAEDAPPPPPAPTISLNIGGPRPPPAQPQQPAQPAQPAAVQRIAPVVAQTPPRAATPETAPAPAASTTFTLERAATDADAIQREAQRLVDQQTLEELYGKDEPIDENGAPAVLIAPIAHAAQRSRT